MTDGDVLALRGVGEGVASKLSILEIRSVDDLINYYPRRYDDYSNIEKISQLKPGTISVRAEIKQIKGRYVRRGMHITEAVASDPSGSVRLVWFNQPYRANATKIGKEYYISGNFELARGRLAIMNPAMELVSEFPVNTARIIPVYRETKGLKSNTIRKLIANSRESIEQLEETLPAEILQQNKLMPKSEAVLAMHFPQSMKQLEEARRRLGFEEIFGLSLASLLNRIEASKEKTHVIPFKESLAKQFVADLPFKLTDSQRKVVWQIYKDMQKDMPMNRLVEGDVGSGKTVVAAMAAALVIDHGYQVALMAPTELLAQQHANSLHKMMKAIARHDEVCLLVGSMKPAQKTALHRLIKAGKVNFIVGTHALISDTVAMKNLGLVIVDEQHRFGVDQRKKLQKKAGGRMPHVLSMTATPIPRTLALTLYGELDISAIKEKPADRLPIITKVVSPNSRKQLYQKIDAELEAGQQMFVVCPLISESDFMPQLSAEKTYEKLMKSDFKHRKVGLLHGKMKPEEKDRIMTKFINHELDILVSTTVIEVGVDVPNATVMLIEGVERFGLAQMHQLRGRVGRSDKQGYCYLMMSDSKEPSRRLRALEASSDGFRLSELDLEIRGPGAIYGHSQSGQLDLRVAKLTDVRLIEAARNSAQTFIDNGQKLKNYPALKSHVDQYRSITNLN
jgi:ATP-dependent DNA helicase RecG